MSEKTIQQKVSTLSKLFDVGKISHLEVSHPTKIASYYKTNKLAYKLFHSKTNFIHVGLSENNKYYEKDLYKQAEIIESYFDKNTKNVLEIGCGKGKNLAFLASRNPNIKFYGIDLEGGQTDVAVSKSKSLDNLHIEYGDFHNLSQLKDKEFDIVFVVEALCHSTNKEKVANEVHKILKQEGLFIVFDGYLGVEIDSLDNYTSLVCKLVEKGMVVDKFENYNAVKSKILKQGFNLKKEIDYSKNILPTLYRFERLTNFAFNLGIFSKILIKVLPSNFTNNGISGYLMPDLIKTGIAKYYLSVFRKV